MPVNLALGHVSNDFMIAALVLYSLAVIAFAGDFAFGRPKRASAEAAAQPARALATIGASASATAASAVTGVPGQDGGPGQDGAPGQDGGPGQDGSGYRDKMP
jgi:hypothetical protein